MLHELCRKGYLTAEGIGRGTRYKLATSISDSKVQNKVKVKVQDKVKVKVQDKAGRGKELIIEELKSYCTVWRKSSDMARHVGRNPFYISRSIIPEMLNRNILIREYPETPRHPAQRYRTVPKH